MANLVMTHPLNPSSSFWAGRSVLLTGHTGFKGSWLMLWLKQLGARVTGLSLQPDTDPSLYRLLFPDEAIETVDVRDLQSVRACFERARPSIVFHMAAQALVLPSYADPVATYATNVMGTVHVLEAARELGCVEAAVVVTSDKCYDNREWVWAYRENEALGGHDPYSNSKACAELVTAAYRKSFFETSAHACHLASARAGNVIGGGDWAANRLIPDIIRSFSKHQPVEIRNPSAIRPWQHVLEPLSGYIRLAECLASDQGASFAEAWNFGPPDEDCRSVGYIVEKMAASWGQGASWSLASETRPHEAFLLKVDAAKARARLGWTSRLDLDQALQWTVEWYRALLEGRSAVEITADQIRRYDGLGG